MVSMGKSLERYVLKEHPDFPIRSDGPSWEEYLPPLSKNLVRLINKHHVSIDVTPSWSYQPCAHLAKRPEVASHPRFIETIAKQGYRFLPSCFPADAGSRTTPLSMLSGKRTAGVAAFLGLLMIVAFAMLWVQ